MLRSYLKVALRSLIRSRGFTAITVIGLAMSLAICLLILTFVWEQKNYDRFHEHGDHIVRILSDIVVGGEVTAETAAAPAPLAPVLQQLVPGIEATSRIGQIRSVAVNDGISANVTGLYAEPSFFELFSFGVEGGGGRDILATPNRVILSRSAGEKLFGEQDPVGRPIHLEGHGDFVVGGVLETPPGRSHLRFDVLASFTTLATSDRQDELVDWMNSWRFATYLLVEDQGTEERLEAVLPEITRQQYAGENRRLDFRVQPLYDIALGPALSNEISSYSIPSFIVYFLGALGLIIITAAGFNYVGLSVARAMRRSNEVGVRRAVGATRRQIVAQFLTEAVLVALLALLVAYALLTWLVPAFNGLTLIQMGHADLDPSSLFEPRLLAMFVAFSFLIGLAAGLYPALRLSRYQPVTALKGLKAARGASGRLLRHSLTGIQFGLALFFVTTTAVLLAQFNYMLNADYGFKSDNILNVDLQGRSYDVLRAEMLRHPDVQLVSATSTLPASGSTSATEIRREVSDEPIRIIQYGVDPGFVENLGLTLVAGRGFSSDIAGDSVTALILNETAVRDLGYDSPADAIDAYLETGSSMSEVDDTTSREVQVIGVVADYQYDKLVGPIQAMSLYYSPGALRYANVRVRPGTMDAVEAHLETVWERIEPVHPAVYARFEAQLTSDNLLNQLFSDAMSIIALVSALAVVISCLGLLGMAVYTVETRVKEVGLRKVLGAGTRSIVLLLSREFIRLLAIATVIALPLAVVVNRRWLSAFANHVDPGVWLFAGCAVLVGMVALAVVVSQTLRASGSNPVDSLRYE